MDREDSVAELARGFNVHDPRLAEPIYEVLAHMRAAGGVTWSEAHGGYWVITGHDAVYSAAADWTTFSNALGISPSSTRSGKFVPIDYDPPLHRTWRRLLNPLFSPQEAEKLSDRMLAVADSLIDEFVETGSCELMGSFVRPLQGDIFFALVFGLDEDETKYCRDAATDGVFSDDPETRRGGFARVAEFCGRMYEDRAERGRRSAIVAALSEATIDGGPISEQDFRGVLELLVFGGNETTVNALGNVLLHIAQNERDRDRLVADPALVPRAVEESLRHAAPVVVNGRTLARDVEFGGCPMKAGQKVHLSWMSANRDPKAGDSPDVFDLDRERISHASFGIGPHRCLGSHLARGIIQAGLGRVVARLPDVRLAPETRLRYRIAESRGVVEIPVVFSPGRVVKAPTR